MPDEEVKTEPETETETVSEAEVEAVAPTIPEEYKGTVDKYINDKIANALRHIPQEYRTKDNFETLKQWAAYGYQVSQKPTTTTTAVDKAAEGEGAGNNGEIADRLADLEARVPEIRKFDKDATATLKSFGSYLLNKVDESLAKVQESATEKEFKAIADKEYNEVSAKADWPQLEAEVKETAAKFGYVLPMPEVYNIVKAKREVSELRKKLEKPASTSTGTPKMEKGSSPLSVSVPSGGTVNEIAERLKRQFAP